MFVVVRYLAQWHREERHKLRTHPTLGELPGRVMVFLKLLHHIVCVQSICTRPPEKYPKRSTSATVIQLLPGGRK